MKARYRVALLITFFSALNFAWSAARELPPIDHGRYLARGEVKDLHGYIFKRVKSLLACRGYRRHGLRLKFGNGYGTAIVTFLSSGRYEATQTNSTGTLKRTGRWWFKDPQRPQTLYTTSRGTSDGRKYQDRFTIIGDSYVNVIGGDFSVAPGMHFLFHTRLRR